jgi:hypothetical protein
MPIMHVRAVFRLSVHAWVTGRGTHQIRRHRVPHQVGVSRQRSLRRSCGLISRRLRQNPLLQARHIPEDPQGVLRRIFNQELGNLGADVVHQRGAWEREREGVGVCVCVREGGGGGKKSHMLRLRGMCQHYSAHVIK